MSARPVLPLTGGCSCGAIRYEVTSFPLLLYSCNCTDCQTASAHPAGRAEAATFRRWVLR